LRPISCHYFSGEGLLTRVRDILDADNGRARNHLLEVIDALQASAPRNPQ